MEDLQPKTIDEFINASPKESQEVMLKLKNIIEATEPNAEGGISWNVPIYKYNGILAGFSLAKKHVSFGVDSLTTEVRNILEKKAIKQARKQFKSSSTKKYH